MSSPEQIAANRKNCLSSTGPRSDAGKAASSRNAIAHGLSSAEPVLPHEDRSQFLALLERYRSDFAPATAHEEHLVAQMAGARWKLDRVERIENALLGEAVGDSPGPDHCLAEAMKSKDGDAFARLERYRANLERTYHRCAREFRVARKFQNEADRVANVAKLRDEILQRGSAPPPAPHASQPPPSTFSITSALPPTPPLATCGTMGNNDCHNGKQ